MERLSNNEREDILVNKLKKSDEFDVDGISDDSMDIDDIEDEDR